MRSRRKAQLISATTAGMAAMITPADSAGHADAVEHADREQEVAQERL
jgi:hypothetical protein